MRLRKNVSDALTSATDPACTRKNVVAAHANTGPSPGSTPTARARRLIGADTEPV
jgi:hypothetical protein